MSDDYFRFDEVPYFRVKIVKERGAVVALEGHYDNGDTDLNPIIR